MPFIIDKGNNDDGGERRKLKYHPVVRETDMAYISSPEELKVKN
jgi:hypothetical protein